MEADQAEKEEEIKDDEEEVRHSYYARAMTPLELYYSGWVLMYG